jgi:hypothetical protein
MTYPKQQAEAQMIFRKTGGFVQGNMTLRDYFAAKAMQGFIAAKAWHPDFVYPADFNFDASRRADESVAEAAYKYADAMLKERIK